MAKKQIQEVCERLATFFIQAVPRQQALVKGRKQPSAGDLAAGVESGLRRFYEVARAEREQQRLGVIGRARVAFGLQQRLFEAGYPPVLVKQVLFAMLMSAFVGKKR